MYFDFEQIEFNKSVATLLCRRLPSGEKEVTRSTRSFKTAFSNLNFWAQRPKTSPPWPPWPVPRDSMDHACPPWCHVHKAATSASSEKGGVEYPPKTWFTLLTDGEGEIVHPGRSHSSIILQYSCIENADIPLAWQ